MEKQLPKGWKWVRLGEVCTINPRFTKTKDMDEDTIVSFVPMADINENEVGFEPKNTKKLSEVSNSYTYFINNDVLLAKVTPCFENGKAGIARNLISNIGFGSSEYYVLRPTENILPEWIYLCVTTPTFRKAASAQMTGTGGLQRVPRVVVEGYQIPLPPLPTQKKIVEILEAADSLRKLRREADEKMQDLIPSLFVEMFGDPATNPKGWEMVTLEQICKRPQYGLTASAIDKASGPKFLRITDIQDRKVDWEKVPYCSCDNKEKKKYMLKPGDIVVARIGATTGKAYLVKDCPESMFASYLIRLQTTEALLPEILFSFMDTKFYWSQINSAKGARLKEGVNIPILSSLKFPLPSLSIQQEFAARVEEIEAEKARQAKSKNKLDDLFNSLMQRAFNGELVA